MKRHTLLSLMMFAAACALPLQASEPAPAAPRASALLGFELLGCSGTRGEGGAPTVWRFASQDKMTYLVRHADACGLDRGTAATASVRDGRLSLGYHLDSTSGLAAACECEYWAKFTVSTVAEDASSVDFNGQPARLGGDWPGGH